MSEAEVQVRLACEEDYEGVLEMSQGVYNGFDYLPSVYHEWLKKPNRLIFVAQLGRELVGLRALCICDEGTTYICEAARTHFKFRRRGINAKLEKAVHDFVRENYPCVLRERKVSLAPKPGTMVKNDETILSELEIYHFFVDKRSITHKLQHIGPPRSGAALHFYNKSDVEKAIFSEPAIKGLFPAKMVVVSVEPYEALRSNIDSMFDKEEVIFAEKNPSDSNDGKFPKSFSHGRYYATVELKQWICSVYARDPVLFRAHVIQQLKIATERIESDFAFVMNLLESSTSDITRYGYQLFEEELGLKPVPETMCDRHWVLCERTVNHKS